MYNDRNVKHADWLNSEARHLVITEFKKRFYILYYFFLCLSNHLSKINGKIIKICLNTLKKSLKMKKNIYNKMNNDGMGSKTTISGDFSIN